MPDVHVTSHPCHKHARLLSVLSIAAFVLMLPSLTGAQPSASPPGGNVNPLFNGLTISDGANENLSILSNGVISNPSGSVSINDVDGLSVNGTSGSGAVVTVTGNGAHNVTLQSDGWVGGSGGVHLGGDGTFGGSNLVVYPGGEIIDNNGAVTVWDGDGLDVQGPITNTNGQLILQESGTDKIILNSDTHVNDDLTVYNDIVTYGNVESPTADINVHLSAKEIGNYGLERGYHQVMPASSVTHFDHDTMTERLACPQGSIAVSCNFEVYNGTTGCSEGNPTGGLNRTAAYETYSFMDPIYSGAVGGVCSKSLRNTWASDMCGYVSVICWDPDGA